MSAHVEPGVAAPPSDRLPSWTAVLSVVAHPDDESFALGAVLDSFARSGARVAVLCLTRGEASTLHGVPGELDQVRSQELAAAAAVLGVAEVSLLGHPDGRLAGVDLDRLRGEVTAAARATGAQGLLVFDRTGVTGHPDHAHATLAALAAAEVLDLPVLGWTIPDTVAVRLRAEHGVVFDGHPRRSIDLVVDVDRTRQLEAVRCHASQALPGSVLWRRLELLGDREHLRWLRPEEAKAPVGAEPTASWF
ncbi:MAG TPA: PIG-L family deacetylase [Nocardioides sp.]|uniref:PIG-L deacetylase family protein n=1 Tax=Nocardioides sp. TaxID=35761 RepID=UPI002CEB740F|nr:PIG-L family deacetylase [Nocardioides sp.]HQR27132.1 PIG-L family deacetylase [Nocardioides sp.]